MSTDAQHLEELLHAAEEGVADLRNYFEEPTLVAIQGRPFFRHGTQNDLLMSYLKCVRAVSSLNACRVLLESGYVQEIGALCRCIDDFTQDVMFLSISSKEEDPTRKHQERLVEEFYQEEFENLDDLLGSRQSRDIVPRAKVHAAIARAPGQPLNPSDVQEVHNTLHKAMSGYIHGAYGHVMELYGGTKGELKFHVRGMLGTPRIRESNHQLQCVAYRTLGALEVVALRSEARDVAAKLRAARDRWDRESELSTPDPHENMQRLKSGAE